jgi:spore germination cell wall hydrolase CwlJ-like protein
MSDRILGGPNAKVLPLQPEQVQQRDPLIDRLTQLAYGEDQTRVDPQMIAGIVASVKNRTALRGYPEDPIQVMEQPHQYNPFDPRDPNYPKVQSFTPAHPQWQAYETAVKQALESPAPPPFTHYISKDLYESGRAPGWMKQLKGITKIGSHVFATEPRRKKNAAGTK